MIVRRYMLVPSVVAIAALAGSCTQPSLDFNGAKIVKPGEFLAEAEQDWRMIPLSHNTFHPDARCYFAMARGTSNVDRIYCGPIRHDTDGGAIGGTGPWDTYLVDGSPADGGYELDASTMTRNDTGFGLPPDVVLVRPDRRKPPKDAEAWSRTAAGRRVTPGLTIEPATKPV